MNITSREGYESAARDFLAAFEGDSGALERLNSAYGRTFRHEDLRAEVWRRVYAYRQRAFKESKRYLLPAEAQLVIAQDAGYGGWEALVHALETGTPTRVDAFAIDESTISPRRWLNDAEWDRLIDVARERRIASLEPAA
jgi:hypothetical protein